jgi:hypothetical protein
MYNTSSFVSGRDPGRQSIPVLFLPFFSASDDDGVLS